MIYQYREVDIVRHNDNVDVWFTYGVRISDKNGRFVDVVYAPSQEEAFERAKTEYPNPNLSLSNVVSLSIAVTNLWTYDGMVVTSRRRRADGSFHVHIFSPNSEQRVHGITDTINYLLEHGHFTRVRVVYDFDVMVTNFDTKG